MRVSVVTISYNTCDLLRKSLNSVYDSSCGHEIETIVVDNASADDSVAMLKREFPQVIVIENKDNLGFAAACNQAHQKATGDFLILLNSDAWVKPGSIDAAVDFMQEHPECGIAGGHLTQPCGGFAPSARRFPNTFNKFLVLSGLADRYPQSKLFGRPDYTHFDHKSVMEVDWVPGAFTIYRQSLLKGVGLFDERYFMYFEEVDLCRRAKIMGWKVYFNPKSQVTHIGGASCAAHEGEAWESSGSQLMSYRIRSEILYFRKNHGLFSVVLNLGFEMLWNALIYIYNLRWNAPKNKSKRSHSQLVISEIVRAMKDTRMGKVVPEIPW